MIEVTKLRKRIGFLGMLLPWLVLILSLIYQHGFPESISATYYIPNCITPFMIILGSASILLLCYKGYDLQDKIVCSLAGCFGLGVCLFPCGLEDEIRYVGTFGIPSNISGILHNISAIIFFVLLAYNSLFLFTKTSSEMTAEKRKRNIIYKICGIGMFASFILLVPFMIFDVAIGVWIVETIALTLFGISWITKSDSYRILFKDPSVNS